MLAFYMDQHVPAQITQGLRQRGLDVLTALEDDSATLDDELLLARASTLSRVLVTQDKDFLRICHRWQASLRDFVGVVFVFQRWGDFGRTIEYLELVSQVMSAADMRGRVEFVPAG